MKKLILIAVLALCAAAAFGQQGKLVVTPFENRGARQLDAAALDNLQDFLINAFINTGRFQVPGRNALELLVVEQMFQLSDWADDKKSAEMGKVLNADYIVRVIAMHDGETNVLTARMLDVNTANGLAAAEMDFTTQGDARRKMDGFVAGLLQRLGGGGTRPSAAARPGAVPEGFVLVEGGTFQMGSTSGGNDEKPVHSVTVKSFHLGKYPVTQKEWREVMGTTVRQQRDMADKSWPLTGEGDNYPMYYVSWHEAVEYCNRRSMKEGLTPAYRGSGNSITCDWNASGYRLPTEAEWEYAAKGGAKDYLTSEYSGSNSVDAVAWYNGNSGDTTHPVGTKAPNALGIYDMSGNVWEWCWDWYSSYGNSAQTDPMGASSGSDRVWRGGSWNYSAEYVRSAYRYYDSPSSWGGDLGFRLVRP